MDKAKFNYGWVIAVIALMAYSYITFMGLVYLQFCGVGLSALIVLLFYAIILSCVLVMCKAKHTRWLRLGSLGQVFFGFIVFVLLISSSVLFSHYTRIIKQQTSVKESYCEAVIEAQTLDDKYEQYIDDRVNLYEESLKRVPSSSPVYKDLFSNSVSLGVPKSTIIKKCSSNLRLLLRGGQDRDEIMNKRNQWLQNKDISVWNLHLPSNIRDITNSVNQWIDNYRELSDNIYTGEDNVLPFEDTSFNTNIDRLNSICKSLTWPSFIAVLLALCGFILILLPWIITPKNIASFGGDFDDVVEMPEEDD